MKRIKSACLNQTVHFQLKEDVSHNIAVSEVKAEYESYKKLLERNRTQYKIVEEKTIEDGSIVIKIKKQVNGYDVGDYFD